RRTWQRSRASTTRWLEPRATDPPSHPPRRTECRTHPAPARSPTCPRRCRPVGLAKWRTHLEPADQAVLSHSLETSTSSDASIATEKRDETEHVWLWIVYLRRRPLSLGAKDNVPTLCV